MNILFLHGWHSVPGCVKPTYLVQHGHEVINPALDDDDFERALRGSADSGALLDKADGLSPELRLIIAAWSELPEAVKHGILAMSGHEG